MLAAPAEAEVADTTVNERTSSNYIISLQSNFHEESSSVKFISRGANSPAPPRRSPLFYFIVPIEGHSYAIRKAALIAFCLVSMKEEPFRKQTATELSDFDAADS